MTTRGAFCRIPYLGRSWASDSWLPKKPTLSWTTVTKYSSQNMDERVLFYVGPKGTTWMWVLHSRNPAAKPTLSISELQPYLWSGAARCSGREKACRSIQKRLWESLLPVSFVSSWKDYKQLQTNKHTLYVILFKLMVFFAHSCCFYQWTFTYLGDLLFLEHSF